MFLNVRGVTGEAVDPEHTGEIEVVSWSWGMQAPGEPMAGRASGKTTFGELIVVKGVDQSTPTLMSFLRSNKLVADATLTVRKAGKTPLDYLKIELQNVRVASLKVESEGVALRERLSLGFSRVRVAYTPQADSGAKGGGDNVFEADTQAGT